MTVTTTNHRLRELVTVVEQLYPRAEVTLSRVGRDPSALRLVPSSHYPRMAVPAGVPAAAADALSRPSAGDGRRTGAPRELLSRILAQGLGPAVMPYGLAISDRAGSIVEHLEDVLGHPVVVSLTVGSARANRKPILNVHSLDGREVGFAKVGLGPLTDRLVTHEGTVLDSLPPAAAGRFQLPRRLHSGTWNGHAVLLMSALRPDVRQSGRGLPHDVAAAIVASVPLETTTVAASAWLDSLQEAVTPLHGTDDAALPRLLADFAREFAGVRLPTGAWHGDFGPWNMAYTSTLPMVWDWERYESGVPAGMDAIHFAAHRTLRRIGELDSARDALAGPARESLRRVLGAAASLEAPSGPLLDTITLAYLFTIAARFTLESRSLDGGPVRELARWHHGVIADQLPRMVRALDHEAGNVDGIH